MDAREYIGAGINLIQSGDNPCKNIRVRINMRTEVCAVWENGTDEKTQCHAGEKESTQAVIILLACEEEIHHRASYIEKPQNVWYDEILTEWDEVIQIAVNNGIFFGNGSFQVGKPGEIHEHIGQYPGMTIFFQELFHKFTYPF